MERLVKDERIIRSLDMADTFTTVGEDAVTKIEAYDENGEMAPVTWFTVWCGDQLRCRVNSKFVRKVVYYWEPTPDA